MIEWIRQHKEQFARQVCVALQFKNTKLLNAWLKYMSADNSPGDELANKHQSSAEMDAG